MVFKFFFMKKLLFILSVFCFTAIKGQNVLTVTPGATISDVPAGTIPNGQPRPPILTLENMDLNNESNSTEFNIRFSGNTNSIISGAGSYGNGNSIIYSGFDIAKTGGAKLILLSQNTHVHGQVIFTSGYLDLNGHVLCLYTLGEIIGESENSRIIGPSGGYVQYRQPQTFYCGGLVNWSNV